jgi:hypothetical protein
LSETTFIGYGTPKSYEWRLLFWSDSLSSC